MFLDVSPLARYRDYRLLFVGQMVSAFGSMLTYVALPYQIYHLTGSSLAVGMIGIVELVPLLFTALAGGAYADAVDRRKLLIIIECILALCSLGLALNSESAHPHAWIIYLLAGLSSAASGFHGPAYSAMMPRLVSADDLPKMSALNSASGTISSIAGPAVGGILIAAFGLPITYLADVATFGLALVTLAFMKSISISEKSKPVSLSRIVEGLKYARSRDELIGTYLVDFVAVVFGMPMALFPAVAESFGGASVVGWLYSAPAFGALVAVLLSRWTTTIKRHGAAVIVAALVWGLAIIGFGFSLKLWLAVLCLAIAGGADQISSIFRNTIWNSTIPDHLRGRLAGIEMIGYMSGPLMGNAESGLVAAIANTQISIISGGILCVLGVVICATRLPRFWSYDYGEWLKRPKS